MRNLLADLNSEQQQVVRATHGPVLVLAGAGSGKTRALTYRIAYLLQQKIARPSEIMAVTFTNKAAGEMKERVRKLTADQQVVPSAIGTFHSLGARMLRDQSRYIPRTRGFTICDTDDSVRLVRQAMEHLNISRKEFNPRNLSAQISQSKSSLLKPDDIAADTSRPNTDILASIFASYEKLLARNDAYDFDDLLIVPLQLLQRPDVLKEYQQRWRWLSVDEYQDTNTVQDQFLKLLAGSEKNICVVGDDYQAIYSWRGAKVDHILQFEKAFPNCTTVYLTQNYRSTVDILEAANAVIADNSQQMHKRLWTAKGQGVPVQVLALPSSKHEAVWLREQVEQAVHTGSLRGNCVVLYRTNAQSREFEEEFLTHGIPYTIVGGFRFYERREVKDALALLQFWVNPSSTLAMTRIGDALWRGIGPKTIHRWEERAQSDQETLAQILKKESAARAVLRPVARTFEQARSKKFETVSDLLAYLIEGSGYSRWLKAQPDGEERWENIKELLNVTAVYSDVTKLLEEVALLSDIDTFEEEQDRVTCMTLHASKGLEFERVFVVGCEEELLPHINSVDNQAQMEEERRLLYVGMTRAKQQLTLTYAQMRYRNGSYMPRAPSRFLSSLPEAVEHIDTIGEGDLLPTPDIIRADLL